MLHTGKCNRDTYVLEINPPLVTTAVLSVESLILVCFGFALLRFVIGPKSRAILSTVQT